MSPRQVEWLGSIRDGGHQPSPVTSEVRDHRVTLNYFARLGLEEILLRLTLKTTAPYPELRKELGLTSRESEVLSWLSKGKINRDIAQIRDLSPRTIDKHLEQVYAKLGVENRTSAAAVATRMQRRDSDN